MSDENDPPLRRQLTARKLGSAKLFSAFESHVQKAQDLYLSGKYQEAETEATKALRIRPTALIFALLATIAESQLQYRRALDFRLLQAFLAPEKKLWSELLHDFLKEEMYYKAAVCLARLVVLEKNDEERHRMQLQLADLYIGLGDIKRAGQILENMWRLSDCSDSEVFALLSSLYFQLGKWETLHRLIVKSLHNTFIVRAETPAAAPNGESAPGAVATPTDGDDRNNNTINDDDDDDGISVGSSSSGRASSSSPTSKVASWLSPAAPGGGMNDNDDDDDFDFDKVVDSSSVSAVSPSLPSGPLSMRDALRQHAGSGDLGAAPGASASAAATTTTTSSDELRALYDRTHIRLPTPESVNNFFMVVNVHAELLNEQSKFSDTIALIEFAAACAERPSVLDLPPDLLLRLGTAYAFQGDPALRTPCTQVFAHLLESCVMEEHADVLVDAATVLSRAGMHRDAHDIFVRIARYFRFRSGLLQRELGEAEAARDARAAAEAAREKRDADTVVVASLYGQAKALHQLSAAGEDVSDIVGLDAGSNGVGAAEVLLREALSLDPEHLEARLLLARIVFYNRGRLEEAAGLLAPHPTDPALHAVQLNYTLTRMYLTARRYADALHVGIPLCGVIFSSEPDDGDAMSVAPGTRRSQTALSLPSLSVASSAIVPAATLAARVGGPASSGASEGSMVGALATSIRSTSSTFRQAFRQQGRAALTTTVYGSSAAASIAAGTEQDTRLDPLGGATSIFQFRRTRKRPRPSPALGGDKGEKIKTEAEDGTEEEEDGGKNEGSPGEAAGERRRRLERVTQRKPSEFWGADTGAEEASREEELSALEEMAALEAENSSSHDGGGGGPPEDAIPSLEELSKQFDDPVLAQLFIQASTNTADIKTPTPLEMYAHAHGASPVAAPSIEAALAADGGDDVADPERLEALRQLYANNQGVSGASPGKAGVAGVSTPLALSPSQLSNPGFPAVAGGFDPSRDRVTLQEVLGVLQHTDVVTLATSMVDCYVAVGRHAEAHQFATRALTAMRPTRRAFQKSRMRIPSRLLHQMRMAVLRTAITSGDRSDVFRTGFRLLCEDAEPRRRQEVLELLNAMTPHLHSVRQVRFYMTGGGGNNANSPNNTAGSDGGIATDGGPGGDETVPTDNDEALVGICANRHFHQRSYLLALPCYLWLLQRHPQDVYLNFMVGLSYCFGGQLKSVRAREACVSAGLYYLRTYQQLAAAADPRRTGEALYNTAHCLQFLGHHHLAVPLYEEVARRLPVPDRCSLAVQRAAQVNLYHHHRWIAGQREAALADLPFAGFN